jgi:hypothetical protein
MASDGLRSLFLIASMSSLIEGTRSELDFLEWVGNDSLDEEPPSSSRLDGLRRTDRSWEDFDWRRGSAGTNEGIELRYEREIEGRATDRFRAWRVCEGGACWVDVVPFPVSSGEDRCCCCW